MFQVNFNRDPEVRVVIRQNNEAAYAFLLQNQKFISYVWLYNLAEPAREKVESYRGELAVNFVDDVRPDPIIAESKDDFEVLWSPTAEGEIGAGIYIRGKLVGKLIDGSMPGHSRNALRDSLLALTYEVEDGFGGTPLEVDFELPDLGGGGEDTGHEPGRRFQVVIRDDGVSCHAYLMDSGQIVSSVWLYNVTPRPSTFPDAQRGEQPKNPHEFVGDNMIAGARAETDFSVEWIDGGNRVECSISLRGTLLGSLPSDEPIGKAILALKDGPLARTMN